MLFVSALCLAACSDDPDVAPLKRDTDAVELTYNSGATTQISVRLPVRGRRVSSVRTEAGLR